MKTKTLLRPIIPTPGFAQSIAPDAPATPVPSSEPQTTEEHLSEKVDGIRSFLRECLFNTATPNFMFQVAVGFTIGFAVSAALLILFAHTLRPTATLQIGQFIVSAHTNIPNLSLPMIQIIVAMLTLLYLAWLLVRRAPGSSQMGIVANLFILNAGLQALVWLSQLLERSESFTAASLPAVAAVLLVLAFLWDLLTSGEQTNGSSRHLPRFVRVCLYAGYSIVSITITLYLSIAPASSGAFAPETWTPSGVTDLGVAMLLAVFIIGVARAQAQAGIQPQTTAGATAQHEQTQPEK